MLAGRTFLTTSFSGGMLFAAAEGLTRQAFPAHMQVWPEPLPPDPKTQHTHTRDISAAEQ